MKRNGITITLTYFQEKKKSKEKGKVYSSHKPENPVSKQIQPKDKSKRTNNVP